MNVLPQDVKTRSCTDNELLKLEIIAKYAEHCQAKYAEHGRVSVMKVNIVSVHLSCILKKATMEFTATERGSRKLIKDGYMYVFKKRLANDTPLGNANYAKKVNVEVTLNSTFLKISLSKEMSIPILHLKPNAT